MGKDLTYDDLEGIIRDLKSELADQKEIEANAHRIFNEFKEVAERLRSGIYRFDLKSRRFFFFNRAARVNQISIGEDAGGKGGVAVEGNHFL